MAEQQNIQVVRDMFNAFKRGDIPALMRSVADEVVWEVPGPPHVPYAGRRFGCREVEKFFELVERNAEFNTFEPREFIAQADKVVAVGHYSGRAKPTGRELVSDFSMVFDMRQGKVTHLRQYFDTANMAAAFDTGESKLAGLPANP